MRTPISIWMCSLLKFDSTSKYIVYSAKYYTDKWLRLEHP